MIIRTLQTASAVFLIGSVFSMTPLQAKESREEAARTGSSQWKFWGGNLHNTHHAEAERVINRGNVGALQTRWVYETAGSVSAIPTVEDGVLYVPDWGPGLLGGAPFFPGGKLHAVDIRTGKAIWSRPISDYTDSKSNNISRTSPVIFEDLLIFGDVVNMVKQVLPFAGGGTTGATLYAVHKDSGELVWKTQLDAHPAAQVTQSPVIWNGRVYIGVSSIESILTKDKSYPCCTFRGSMMSLDARTGRVLWKTYMVPDNRGQVGGYSGGAVWGSSPSIDVDRGLVYVTTGQNYDVPEALKSCIRDNAGDAQAIENICRARYEDPSNLFDAVVALDLDTGAIDWSQKLSTYDAWNIACSPEVLPLLPVSQKSCPNPEGADFDFGQAPMIITVEDGGASRDLLAVGQKSGVYWALDPDQRGAIVWATRVGPGGKTGGMEFGSAFDGERIYAQLTNSEHVEFALTSGSLAGTTVNGGLWVALDPRDGALLWQTPDPTSFQPLKGLTFHPSVGLVGKGYFAKPKGPLTVANGVLFAGSMDLDGHMYAFDTRSGEILWRFESGGSVMSAPAVVDGVLYWGSGYKEGTDNNKLYAFGLPD